MRVGQQIGPFEIERELGAGAMGAVYLARYTKTGQRVAIKIIAPGLGSNERAHARFEREAEILKQLKHPHIVRLLATGRFQRSPFYAMEYVDGEPLDELLLRRGQFGWEEVVEIGKQVCAALQHAHAAGIVHRDLKPSNLMVTRDRVVKLTDFGIAKDLDVTQLTTANCTVGTAAYMSPEQCKGDRNLTGKSDLYSLGVVLYELLTGRKPFRAENAMDMFVAHTTDKFERPSRIVLDIPVWLDTLVCQLMEKKPEHRPLDAKMVAEVLNEVREKVEAQRSAGIEVARKEVRTEGADRDAAAALIRGKRKPKKLSAGKRAEFWLKIVALSAGLVALVWMILYAVWPSAEKRYQKAHKLVEEVDTLIDRGNYDEAQTKAYDAERKLEAIAGDSDDPFAEKAKEQITHLKQGNLYIKGSRALAAGKNVKKAREQGFEELLDPAKHRPGGKYVEKARAELGPIEAPALLQEAREAVAADDPQKWPQARANLDLLLKRYPNSDHTKKARVTLEVALIALGIEQASQAKLKWAEVANLTDPDPEIQAWVAIAKKKIER